MRCLLPPAPSLIGPGKGRNALAKPVTKPARRFCGMSMGTIARLSVRRCEFLPYGLLRPAFPVGRPHNLDLLNMVLEMVGVVQHEVAQSPSSLFRMRAGSLECLLGHPFQQLIILGAEHAEGFQSLRNLASSVIQVFGPGVPVKGMKNRIILGQNLA